MSAIISNCEQYRYRLERDVQTEGNVIAFIGINPSTADAQKNDRTVNKWIGFTQVMGGRRFIVGNLFAFRSKDVSVLKIVDDPVGPDNATHLLSIAADADILVPCWGSRNKIPKELRQHIDPTIELLKSTGKTILTFGFTANTGDPKHPLFLSYSTKMVPLIR